MVTITELLSLVPIFITSLLGAFSQDFIESMSNPKEVNKTYHSKMLLRLGRLFVATTLTVMLVGFGGSFFSISEVVDWKVLCFISFVVGFTGYRIGEWFSTKLGLLRIVGMGSIADQMELDAEKDSLEEMKKKYGSRRKKLHPKTYERKQDKDHVLIELEHMDNYVPRPLEDHLEREGKIEEHPFIAEIVKKKRELRQHLTQIKDPPNGGSETDIETVTEESKSAMPPSGPMQDYHAEEVAE